MAFVLTTHAIVGLALLLAHFVAPGRQLGRGALVVGAVAPAVALAWWATAITGVLDGEVRQESWTWVAQLGLVVDLRADGFAMLMVLVVSGIGLLVHAYALSYFDATTEGLGRLAGLLVLFAGAMLGVVLADDLIVLYGFWELTSVTSFLLIGNQYRLAKARAAALQAILVTGAGGLAMLLGFVILGTAAGTYELSAILADPPAGGVVAVALVLIALGAFTKSAQYPFHFWLPGAMVAPTPISAYLHSATMVKAGVYLIARLAPVFALVSDGWRPLVVTVGLVTMVAGALRALRQHDLKLLLAFGTVSQLGFMVVLFGLGTPEATAAGCAVLLAHAAFKATLFMVVGVVDHGTGTRDVRQLPPLDRSWLGTKVVAVVAAASMAGVPLTFGFVAKELGLDAAAEGGVGASALVFGVLVAGSALTAAYSARFVGGLLGRWSMPGAEAATGAGHPHAPSAWFLGPAVLLAALTLVVGVAPSLLDGLVGVAAGALDGLAADVHLSLWHGVNAALLGSATALAVGAVLYAAAGPVDRVLAVGRRVPEGTTAYRLTIAGMGRLAERVTGVVQSGSMPVYLGVILLTAAVLPGVALLLGDSWPGWPTVVDAWIQVPIVTVLLCAALGSAVVRHRLSAALLLGICGYAMAALFVVQGAPDLALTQAAIETLTTVLFVLALRRLPDRFERRSIRSTRGLRIAIAAAVGCTVFGLALVAGGEMLPRQVSDEMVARAEPDGGGANVVNVILVDIRGLDTLSEITVVAVAAIGSVALARAGRRPRAAPAFSTTGPGGTRRHAFVDVAVRFLVYVALAVSVYLLVAGHDQPGGGFVGGLVAGAAVALRYIAGGLDDVRRMVRVRPWTILGGGVLIAGVTATVPLLLGRPLLDNGKAVLDLPLLGELSVSSALAFDTGVYLVVVGLVFMVFEAFGGDDADVRVDTLAVDDTGGDGAERVAGQGAPPAIDELAAVGEGSAP